MRAGSSQPGGGAVAAAGVPGGMRRSETTGDDHEPEQEQGPEGQGAPEKRGDRGVGHGPGQQGPGPLRRAALRP